MCCLMIRKLRQSQKSFVSDKWKKTIQKIKWHHPNGVDFSTHFWRLLFSFYNDVLLSFKHEFSHCFMGQNLSKVWSMVRADPVLVPIFCITMPIAVCGTFVFGCMFNILRLWDWLKTQWARFAFGKTTNRKFRKVSRAECHKLCTEMWDDIDAFRAWGASRRLWKGQLAS